MLVDSIFFSKLRYCLQLFTNTWGIETMDERETRYNGFTQANLRSLQVLQNKILRLMTESGYDTPTTELLQKANMLSINQLGAYYTLVTLFNIKKSGKPEYLANRLGFDGNNDFVSKRTSNNLKVNFRLDRGREGMLYWGSKLFNSLDPSLKIENSEKLFKKKAEQWVLRKIPAIPY